MYDLIEHNANYSPISGSLWQYLGDKLSEADIAIIAKSKSFKYNVKIRQIPDNGKTLDVAMAVPLKYWRNFRRTLEIHFNQLRN